MTAMKRRNTGKETNEAKILTNDVWLGKKQTEKGSIANKLNEWCCCELEWNKS